LLSFADIQGPLAPPARLVAEPDPAAAAFHAERHARFLRVVAALGPGFGPDFGAGLHPAFGADHAPADEPADYEGGTA